MDFNYCAGCGNKVMTSIRICPSCGERNFSPTPPIAQQPQQQPQQQFPSQSTLPGVRGWLLFLCVSLTIISPLFGAASGVAIWEGFKQYFEVSPSVKNYAMWLIVMSSAISFFSVYAGIRLWSIKPNAVKVAKVFFISQAVSQFLFVVILVAMLQELGVTDYGPLTKEYIQMILSGILQLAIWYTYLCKSKRVKATYV